MTSDARPTPACARHARGFTIVELMIVVLVLGVIAALAMPSFLGALAKSRRADAMGALAQVSQAQERYRTSHPIYADAIGDLSGVSAVSSAGHYAIAVARAASASASMSYEASAEALESSPQRADRRCRTFVITVDGMTTSYSSRDDANRLNPAPDPCWVR